MARNYPGPKAGGVVVCMLFSVCLLLFCLCLRVVFVLFHLFVCVAHTTLCCCVDYSCFNASYPRGAGTRPVAGRRRVIVAACPANGAEAAATSPTLGWLHGWHDGPQLPSITRDRPRNVHQETASRIPGIRGQLTSSEMRSPSWLCTFAAYPYAGEAKMQKPGIKHDSTSKPAKTTTPSKLEMPVQSATSKTMPDGKPPGCEKLRPMYRTCHDVLCCWWTGCDGTCAVRRALLLLPPIDPHQSAGTNRPQLRTQTECPRLSINTTV